jgi:NADH-quinone oxidoreductase subunit A
MENPILSDFGLALLFFCGALIFVAVTLFVAKLIRPDRPNAEKMTSYECGEDPIGTAWTQFNIRFYIVALIFILFDVEVVFLFPWATVFGQEALIEATDGQWGWFALAEMGIFLGILALGLAYAWRKGFLDWVKPDVKPKEYVSDIPQELYQKINERYASSKAK